VQSGGVCRGGSGRSWRQTRRPCEEEQEEEEDENKNKKKNKKK